MRTGSILLGCVFVAGCGFHSEASSTGSVDAPPDTGMIGSPPPPGCTSFSKQLNTCLLMTMVTAAGQTVGDLTITGNASYITGSGMLQLDSGAQPVVHISIGTLAATVDAIVAHDVHLAAGVTLTAKGTMPLAIVATGSITLDKMAGIDLSDGGAGAAKTCSNPVGAAGNDPSGGGGGAGGGYAAAGGIGGPGDGGQTNGGTKSNSIGMPAGPSGGCAGGDGSKGSELAGGAGGAGGGALYLLAADTISLADMTILNASGGGGHGGPQNSNGNAGGGGGGSGGMIWLEALLHITGAPSSMLVANGGGGGEGSDNNDAGHDGQTGQPSMTPAAGGHGGANNGGDGGSGGAGGPSDHPAGTDGDTRNNSAGGGGGGGGVGYIHIFSPDEHIGMSSPPPS